MNTTATQIELDDGLAPQELPDEAAVESWFRELISRGINFHPEETFAEIVDGSGARTFLPEDAERLDVLMRKASRVCDPTTVAMRLSYERLGAAEDAQRVGSLPRIDRELPAIGSQWRLIREVERDGEEVAPYCAYGTIKQASEERVAFQVEGVLPDRLEEPAAATQRSGDSAPLVVWSETEAKEREHPTPALAFLEDAVPMPTPGQAKTLKRERDNFNNGAVELIRAHPVSLIWPFSPEANFPFNALCVEMHYRHLEDPNETERSVMVVIAEDGTILLNEDWA